MSVAATARIGSGEVVSGAEGFTGVIERADDVERVLELLSQDLSDSVLLTDQASATAVAPLLPMLRGVICTQGGGSAHLAIVARALGLPCLMGARLERDLPEGARVRVDAAGGIFAA